MTYPKRIQSCDLCPKRRSHFYGNFFAISPVYSYVTNKETFSHGKQETEIPQSDGNADSFLWRRLWRLHFLAGIIIAPALVWFAVTGLVILYSDSIQRGQHSELYSVEKDQSVLTLDAQLASVQQAHPDLSLWYVTPPRRDGDPTVFSMGTEMGTPKDVFVNPYSAEVLGDRRPDKGLVSFANNTHGSFLPRQYTMPIPSLTGIFGEGDAFRTVEVGEVIVEVVAGWGLVLAASGLYLWWPRKGSKKRLLIPRFRGGGRPMWRDMHASAGTVVSIGLIFFVMSGLPWATFWGNEFSTVASKVTPNAEGSYAWGDPGPPSVVPKVGDLTRNGVRIPWASTEDVIPPSSGGGHVHSHSASVDHGAGDDAATETSPLPATRVSLEVVHKAAQEEGMVPGYSITPPVNTVNDDKSTTYGSFVIVNPWPSSLSEQGALYLDQFSGKTLGKSDANTWGAIQKTAELGVQTHMGTQFGLINRIFLTAICVLVFWSITSAMVMWLRRRRRGALGIPRRVPDVSVTKSTGITAIVLGIIYPLWGASAVVLLACDALLRKMKSRRNTVTA